MRLWSLHPRYLDRQGLLALWREALLAQKVLQGGTRGYRHHPQLARFRQQADPLAAIAAYLWGVQREAQRRGYRFRAEKIAAAPTETQIPVTRGQMIYERQHLARKLRARDPERLAALDATEVPAPHPLFVVVPGPVEAWERVAVDG
ncbi:MAG: hypothetical protein JXA37_01580 [Chloroflexia bacterium]|nr:hypothetical protein [Chloroflexia bacterium]